MADVAVLTMYPTTGPSPLETGELGYAGHRIDCYDLTAVDLRRYAVLVVPPSVDQEFLARNRGVVRAFLDSGRVLIFGGHLHRDWLPGAEVFQPIPTPSLPAYRVARVADHPIFAGINTDDLTFRRGVAGFFARGHHPVPEGAEVLVWLDGGEPVTYVDQVSTAGTIVVQATCDLISYAFGLDNTASRLPRQLLAWAVTQAVAKTRALESLRPARRSGLAAVYGGSSHHHRALTAPKYARHLAGGLLYLPDLADVDLTGLDGLIVPERIHRGMLNRAGPRILELLDAGGTVAAFCGGEPPPEFLPGVRWEHRPTNYWWWLQPDGDLGLRTPNPDHSFFGQLTLRDCTWHYHGVLDPPARADVLITLATGEALMYVDRHSTAGTLVVATLDPLSHYGAYFMPAAERFLDGFMPWIARTAGAGRS
jgi:hypothetical protein